ncbi:E3 UFM1-protein ligase 1 homolog [Zophobas morio]|uniref:E3 UFM1-protein ligase 1 homolog n=1 Tax=Zophobas morio TaxID=2755281 RepID=UPI003083D419
MLKNNSLKEKTCFFKENSERLIQLVVGDIVEKETTLLIHYGMSKPFLTSLLNYLVPKLFQETAKEFSSSTLEIEELKKVQRKNDLEQKFSQLLDSAFLFTESFKILPKPRKLEKYFMATLTGQLTLLLKGYSLMNFDWCPSESEEKNKSSEDLETVLSKFPDHEGLLALNELENSTKNNKKDCRPHTFLSKLITTAKLNGLFYRKRDKRKEKQLKIALASSLRFQLHRTEDYASAFHIIVLLLFYEKTGCLLHSDGKCVPSIIENIHELSILAEETVADLQSLQDSIVKMTAFDAEEPKKEVLCSFVQNRLEDLKKELRIHTEWCDKNNGRE